LGKRKQTWRVDCEVPQAGGRWYHQLTVFDNFERVRASGQHRLPGRHAIDDGHMEHRLVLRFRSRAK
jgi:hypothetical protein